MVVVGGLMVGWCERSWHIQLIYLSYGLLFSNALALACCLREMALLSSIGHMCAHITTANIFISFQMPPSIYSSISSGKLRLSGCWAGTTDGCWFVSNIASLLKTQLQVPSLFADTCPYVLYIYIIWYLFMPCAYSTAMWWCWHADRVWFCHLGTGERISFVRVLVLPQSEIKSVHVTPQVPKCERTVSLPQWIGRHMSPHAILHPIQVPRHQG